MWKHKNFINLQLWAAETWVLNETIDFSVVNNTTISVVFSSDGTAYKKFDIGTNSIGYGTTNNEAWSANNYTTSTGWKKEAYRTVTFDNGVGDTDSPLYKFLVANGTKQIPTPTLTFKHFYDAGTIGTGTIKFRHYSQQEPSSGETWMLNETLELTSNHFYVDFTSNNTNYTTIYLSSYELSYAGGGSEVIVYASKGGWIDQAYRTITFATSPTGDLLTWLQANGTKQGEGQ